tara:strand:- start:215 stop:496 length:282 start_codon:yes stop_codon:yes gene_type:complete
MATKNITPKLDDNSGMTINIRWLVQIIVVIAMATWGYASITERIGNNKTETKSLRGNQNNYIFPDIRELEEKVIKLEKEVIVLRTELKFHKDK